MSIDTETEFSAPNDTVSRREARARQRRRSLLALGIIAALVLPFVLAAGWFVWELSPPATRAQPCRWTSNRGGVRGKPATRSRPTV